MRQYFMAKKRKTLPKDFDEILKRGNIEEIILVFDKCELDAYGDYNKQTALAFTECPPEFDKWIIGKGLGMEITDYYGYTPLQARASHVTGNIKSLLELGAKIDTNNEKGTALHCAAKNNVAEHVKTLLEYGAGVDDLAPGLIYGSKVADNTPLEYSLFSCQNIHIVNTVEIAKTLLAAGARKTEKMKDMVIKIGTQFEYYRTAFNKDSVQQYSDALDELYIIFDVTPVPGRVLHDGKSRITVKGDTLEKQFSELWELLVPSQGSAQTLQGEVIRIAGRITDELERNGGFNWDNDYKIMADSFLVFIQQGQPLSAEEIDQTSKIVSEVKRKTDMNVDLLAELSVKWVLNNPIPLSLPSVKYNR